MRRAEVNRYLRSLGGAIPPCASVFSLLLVVVVFSYPPSHMLRTRPMMSCRAACRMVPCLQIGHLPRQAGTFFRSGEELASPPSPADHLGLGARRIQKHATSSVASSDIADPFSQHTSIASVNITLPTSLAALTMALERAVGQ